MRDVFKQYFISLYKDIPQEVYEGLLSVFCLGIVLFVAFKGLRTGFKWPSALLLTEYIFLLFCSTVIFRPTGEARQYDFHPFWSYYRPELLMENIMNVVVFVPVGMLLCVAFKQMTWWKALLIGCCISISIESLQLLFMRGFSEVDDVMHNTVGCLIGWCMMKSSRFMVKGFQNLWYKSVCKKGRYIYETTV